MRKHCQRGFISTITLYFYLYIDFRSYLGKRPLTEREREKMDIINKGLLTKWLRFVAKRSHNKFCMRTELYGVKQKSGKSVLTLKWNHFSVSLYWFSLYKRNDANEQPCTKGFLLVCRGGGGSRRETCEQGSLKRRECDVMNSNREHWCFAWWNFCLSKRKPCFSSYSMTSSTHSTVRKRRSTTGLNSTLSSF